MIKELAKEFEGKFSCLEENTEKYIVFSVPVETVVTRIHKISYRLQFIDSARFMASSLSNLADNLSEGTHRIRCTNCNKCYLEYTNFKDDLI